VAGNAKLATDLHHVLKTCVELYFHFPICLHGVVLKYGQGKLICSIRTQNIINICNTITANDS